MCPSLHFLSMNFFEMLVLVHFVADWIFQSQKQAEMKSTKPDPYLIDHSLIYTAFFVPLLWWKLWPAGSASALAFIGILLLLFVSHAFLDYRRFEIWLLKFKGIMVWKNELGIHPYYLDENKQQKDMDMGLFWVLLITIDQILHMVVLAFIALILS